MVQVGKGVALDPLVLGVPDAGAPAIGAAGGKTGVQQPGGQSQQRTDPHLHAFVDDVVEVVALHAHVDEVRHQHRDHQLKKGLHDHQQRPQEHVPPVGAQVGQQPFKVFHRPPSSPLSGCDRPGPDRWKSSPAPGA